MIRFGFVICGLKARIAETLVPYLWAMKKRVSPRCTVYWKVPVGQGPGGKGGRVGMQINSPGKIRFGLMICGFKARIAETVVPYLWAMKNSVSPRITG